MKGSLQREREPGKAAENDLKMRCRNVKLFLREPREAVRE